MPRNRWFSLLVCLALVALSVTTGSAAAQENSRSGDGLRVELRAPIMVMLSAPVPGRLAVVNVKDGDDIKKDQILIQIDDVLAKLRVVMAQAKRAQADTQLRVVEKLHKLGSRGALDVDMARAQFREAEAEVSMAAEMVDRCRVKAPFDGRVTQLDVKVNQHIPEGAPLLEVAEAGPLETEFMMPSSWLETFNIGALFWVKIDETNKTYPAKVMRMGGKVDALTQSIKVYGRLTDDTVGLLPGMSGTVARSDSDSK